MRKFKYKIIKYNNSGELSYGVYYKPISIFSIFYDWSLYGYFRTYELAGEYCLELIKQHTETTKPK